MCCWLVCNICGGNWFGNIVFNYEYIEINDVNGGNNVNVSYIFNSLIMRIEILMLWFIWFYCYEVVYLVFEKVFM